MADDDEEENASADPPPPLGVPEWMVTYGDLMTLLLCFFVLLFIFSSSDVEKYRSMVGSIKEAFGVQTERPEAPYHAYSPIPEERTAKELSKAESDLYSTIQETVSEIIAKEPDMKQSMKVETTEKGVMLRVSNERLFLPGTAYLSPSASILLKPAIDAAQKNKFNILVRNNTTSAHVDTRFFPSVWEISGARAAAAVHGLIVYSQERIKPANVKAMGAGDSIPLFLWNDQQSDTDNNRTEFLFYLPGKEFW